MMRRAVDWMFRSRETGRITIAQFPNLPLGVFLGATVFGWIMKPSGTARTALSVVGTAALALWALDELIRGVNPWRRLLGGGLLAFEAWHYVSR
jgi:hypothetical protein